MIFDLHTFIQTTPNCHMMEIKKNEFPNDYCLNSANRRILKIFTIETLQTPPVVLVSAPLGRWAYIFKIGIVRWLLYHMISNHMLVFHIIYKLQMWYCVSYQTLKKNSWQCNPSLPQTHKLQMLPISVVSCSCGQILEEKRASLEKSPNQSIQLSRLKLWANKYGDE